MNFDAIHILGIAAEIMRGTVRLEGRKALGRFLVAFLAGLQAIIRMQRSTSDPPHAAGWRGFRGSQNTWPCGRSQPVDLAVVGFRVGLQALGMAVSAVPGNGDPGRVLRPELRRRGWCWQSEQMAANALPFSSTSLPCTEVAYCSRSFVWHFPHAFGTLRRHSLRSGLPLG